MAAVAVLALTMLAFRRIEVITLGGILMLYLNLPVVVKKSHAMFQLFSLSLYVLLCVPLAVYIFSRREKLRVDRIFVLLLAFLLTAIVSSFFAKDMSRAVDWILTFLLEGVILYFLILNLVRNLEILKKVIWVLMLGGSLLGSLSLYQELTHSYENKFYGLAQRNTEEGTGEESTTSNGKLLRTRTEVNLANRASGSLGGPNRYAQIMLMILPLALFTFWRERSLRLKLAAALATILILSGITLSYSRGAFVTLMLLLVLLTMMRYVRVSKILTLVLILIPIVAAVAPGYLVRMETILGIEGLFAESTTRQPDAVTRGRLTEMLAAFHCFLDYPLFGVGPGQFTPFYSIEYMQDPDIALRGINKTRRAHILYFELAAETGIIGITIFLAMVILVMYHLLQQRRYWSERDPDLANIATALFLSIVSYLGTAIFLHLSYQRYYWLLLGLVGATLKIFSVAARQTTGWVVSDAWQHAAPATLRIQRR
ncbi:MAG: O-antigen ligase family protein [candidate division KSB1 bacterium]|nr:O-antigen ligase family protein [candidate division KSB1 bacterium]